MNEEMNAEVNRLIAEEVQNYDCGPVGDGDEVNQAISEMIDHLMGCDYPEDTATEAVFDALHDMLEKGEMADVPEINALAEDKTKWVSVFEAKIRKKLEAMGLDLTPLDTKTTDE